MLYHISRNGQNYGPYTLEDLNRYVASGNVLLTDLAKSDDRPDWVPVSQVLGVATPPVLPRRQSGGISGRSEPELGPGSALFLLYLLALHVGVEFGALCMDEAGPARQ